MSNTPDERPPIDAGRVDPLVRQLREHAETLGQSGKPASRQLLIVAADELERLREALRARFTAHRNERRCGKCERLFLHAYDQDVGDC